MYRYYILVTHSSVDWCVGCFYLLILVSRAIMNMAAKYLWGRTPRPLCTCQDLVQLHYMADLFLGVRDVFTLISTASGPTSKAINCE